MHELSICASIARIVAKAAGGHRVEVVRLDVGYLRQVVPESLAYCWDIAVRETPLEGAVLEINHIPARIRCTSCDAITTMTAPVLRCGRCDGTAVELIAGDELLVSSLDIGTDRG